MCEALTSATKFRSIITSFPSFSSFPSLKSLKQHAPFSNGVPFSTNGAQYFSLGQRPRYGAANDQALKGRENDFALSGLEMFLTIQPRALPWAVIFRPFGAAKRDPQFCESAKLEKAIKANLRGLGYGG
jgi:hypothetical protein